MHELLGRCNVICSASSFDLAYQRYTAGVTILRCVNKRYRYWMVEVLRLDEISADLQTKI